MKIDRSTVRVRVRPGWAVTYLMAVVVSCSSADDGASSSTNEAVSPVATALLRGVEQARTAPSQVMARIQLAGFLPPPGTTLDCVVEMRGAARRFEAFNGEQRTEIVVRRRNQFTGYRQGEHSDVHIYDERRAVGVRGDLAFDPRVLGLSALMPCTVEVSDCLWYTDIDSLHVVGTEELGGVSTWRVRAERRGVVSEYWIEEPAFRVHRRTIVRPDMTSYTIDSAYDSRDTSPFPNHVTVHRSSDPGHQREYRIQEFSTDVEIPPDRFEMSTMEIPVNTAVVDYRINKRVGYWNGRDIVGRLVRKAGSR